jgi:SAM-dependent MidA family methyltransferase
MNPGTPLPATSGCSAYQVVRDAIAAAGGWIPFDRYMDLALFAPGSGYYVSGQRQFGEAGDFVTASGISGLFGATLARQVGQVLEASAPVVLEFGAGNGRLAADLLNALGDQVQRYEILEVSPALRALQAEVITTQAPEHAQRVIWRDRLPTTFSGCIVANEVLDAMPVHLVAWTANGILERGVMANGDALAFADRPAQGKAGQAARELASRHLISPVSLPYLSEINLAAAAWIRSLADFLDCGVALLVDYGFPAREYYHAQRNRGTLISHYRHRTIEDVLAMPGEADITAHVDFSSLAEAATEAGLDLLGYANQAGFLIDCGITDLLAETSAENVIAYLPLANQVNRLLSSAEMGELFKVMAVGRGMEDALIGFARSDRRHSL